MRTIVVADLYGVTRELRALLAPLADDAVFISPWDGDACPHASEREAHTAFIAGDGLARYAERIAEVAGEAPACFVAFSVGASAVWLHAASARAHPASVATLFYGSRIRDYAQLVPRFAVDAVFAQHEASFAPADLLARIAGGRVRAGIVAGSAHGFMNPLSPGYDAGLSRVYVARLVAARERQRHAAYD